MPMTNMKLDREAAEDHMMPSPTSPTAPEYPYGLCLQLDTKTLEKLGIKELPKLGAKLTLNAKVIVSYVMEREDIYGGDRNMGLQITDMSLE